MNWEQKFCQMNGVSWAKVLETKEFVHQYSDITGWNDSAGKEAFENAKARYWAQINGFQPNTPLPDPDMLIDNIDHDAPPTELKLYQNLHGSLSEDEGDSSTDNYWITDVWGEGGVILWDSHYVREEEEVVWGDMSTGWGEDQPIIPTGWGDIPVQASVQPDTWAGVMQNSWVNNSVNPTGWDYMAAGGNPPDNWGVVQTSWANNSAHPTRWEPVTSDVNPVTTYGGIVPTGWGEVEERPGNTWNGYNCGVPGEVGQYWNYSSNYCNGDGFNDGNWDNSNQNWNSNGTGRSGWNKSGNRNYNKGKQWKKKEDSPGHFCAPLNQSANGWNAPRSVV